MPFYKDWGFALVAIWVVTFFVNWALYGGDPFGLIGLELIATLAWLIAWGLWSAYSRGRPGARAARAGQMPVHLWIVSGLALIWYGMGAASYMIRQTGGDSMPGNAHAPPNPFLVDAAWAFGVWGGLAASLLLPARSRYAVPAFAISAAGLLVEAVHARPYWLSTGAPGFAVFQGVIAALLLLFYAWRMQRRKVLR